MTLYCKPRREKARKVIVRKLAGAEHLHDPFQRSDRGLHRLSDGPFQPFPVACTDLREAPHSRWGTTVDGGVHWLVTPCGERFFSIGVNVMDGGVSAAIFQRAYRLPLGNLLSRLGKLGASGTATSVGVGLQHCRWMVVCIPRCLGLPTTPNLELGRTARFHWFDPFDPSTAERMRAWARRLVAPYKGNPYRIGYFTDNEVGWWNGALFIYYLKQPATNHTKQHLIALLREHYGNDWERFTRDFVPPPGIASFQHLLHHTGTWPRSCDLVVREFIRAAMDGDHRWASTIV